MLYLRSLLYSIAPPVGASFARRCNRRKSEGWPGLGLGLLPGPDTIDTWSRGHKGSGGLGIRVGVQSNPSLTMSPLGRGIRRGGHHLPGCINGIVRVPNTRDQILYTHQDGSRLPSKKHTRILIPTATQGPSVNGTAVWAFVPYIVASIPPSCQCPTLQFVSS